MYRVFVLCLCMLLSPAAVGLAGDRNGEEPVASPRSTIEMEQTAAAQSAEDDGSDAREMSGMSIVGNDEAPKSLYIVPWKSSDVGARTSLDPMLTEDDVPVDREVFKRRIEFYQISTVK